MKVNNYEETAIKIGLVLRYLRQTAGFKSYETFAAVHNLPRVVYWRLESGKINPTLKTLEKVLNIHDMPFSSLFDIAASIESVEDVRKIHEEAKGLFE